MTATIFDISRCSYVDGPGIRTTVFFKGCNLRCAWCHNPESQRPEKELMFFRNKCIGCGKCKEKCPHALTECDFCGSCTLYCPADAREIAGKDYTVDEVLREVLKDRAFYGATGGLTLSGGEPLLHGRAVLPILQAAKDAGITTAIETCGVFDAGLLSAVVPLTDLFLWDVKDTDPTRHQRNTGGSLETVLFNLRQADALGAKTRLRCILLNGVNLHEAHLAALCKLYHTLHHCEGIELLPYHTYGDDKNIQLGRTSNAHVEWIPTDAKMAEASAYIEKHAVLIRG